jgi:hypothetical protein
MVTAVGAIGAAMLAAGAATNVLAKALLLVTAHPVVAGLTALGTAIALLAEKFNSAQRAAEDLATHGGAALDKFSLAQLESLKSDLEWRIFFEKLDYRQLTDEELAGRRSEAERALAAVNNSIEEIANRVNGGTGTATGGSSPTSNSNPSAPFANQPSDDPWQKFLSRYGLSKHKMGPNDGALDPFKRIAESVGKRVQAGLKEFQLLPGIGLNDAAGMADRAMGAMKDIFAPGGVLSSAGTFNGSNLLGLQAGGSIDKELVAQGAQQNRLLRDILGEVKDAWKFG